MLFPASRQDHLSSCTSCARGRGTAPLALFWCPSFSQSLLFLPSRTRYPPKSASSPAHETPLGSGSRPSTPPLRTDVPSAGVCGHACSVILVYVPFSAFPYLLVIKRTKTGQCYDLWLVVCLLTSCVCLVFLVLRVSLLQQCSLL